MKTPTFSKIILASISVLYIACLIGCTSPKSNQTTAPTDEKKSEQVTSNLEQVAQTMLQPCYIATIGKDTALLKININDGIVTGKLNYMFYEKDKNYGEIKGKLSNDTISVDYTFKSEGIISVREMTFIVRNSQIVEGIGEYVYRKSDNKMVLKNYGAIDYTGKSFMFLPMECNSLK